jgi:alpha-glucoside transport system substrate-binding protein
MVASVALVVLGASGCNSRTTSEDRPVVEVFGNMVGTQGDALGKALTEVSAGSPVQLRYVGVTSFAEQLSDRLDQGDRPGVALVPQPGVLDDLYRRGLVAPLPDDVAAAVPTSYPGELAALATIDGRPRATWLNIDLKSLLWYRPSVLESLGADVPQSLGQLAALSERMRTDGDPVAPWCLTMEAGSSTGWVGTDWVEDYVLRRLGPDDYDRWTRGALSFESPEITSVFDELDALLRQPGAVAGGAKAVLTIPWERAADELTTTAPSCGLVHQAGFLRLSFPAGTSIGPDGDVDVVPMPPAASSGTPPLLVGGNLAVPLAEGDAVDQAMRLLAGPELATLLNESGVFLSPNLEALDGATSSIDPVTQRLLDLVATSSVVRFDGSDLMPPSVGTGTFWQGMRSFFAGEPVSSVLAEIEAGWPEAAAGQ